MEAVRLMPRSIEWIDHDSCVMRFVSDAGEESEVTFVLQRWENDMIGVHRKPAAFFSTGEWSAAEIRAIANAAIQFCLVAQGETPSGA